MLLLSDDYAIAEDTDANVLANLVYVQDLINNKVKYNDSFDPESIDVIVEIIDPKHFDVVNKYGNNNYTHISNNVVISNRYVSKMITQIGERDSLFNFYTDFLTYDAQKKKTDTDSEGMEYESYEIYIKPVCDFFEETPGECTAAELITAVIEATSTPEYNNPTSVLGYCEPGGKVTLFGGDQTKLKVSLDDKAKLIVYSLH